MQQLKSLTKLQHKQEIKAFTGVRFPGLLSPMVADLKLKGGSIMKRYNLGNGHEITVEKGERGIADDYKVTFFEDGKALFSPEYYSKDALEYEFDIVL